jgi:OOP family OmpA-OmpF porin
MEGYMMRRLLVGLLVLATPLMAFAGDEVGHWYLDPNIGGITPDNVLNTTGTKLDYGLAFGYNMTKEWSAELNFNGARLNDRYDSGHLGLYALSLDFLRVWNRDGRFAPYFSLGAGALQAQPSASTASNQTSLMAQAGVGAFLKLWENGDASRSLALRPDIKARFDRFGKSGGPVDYLYTLGLVFSFGPGIPPPVAAAPPPPPPPPPTPPPPPVVKSMCPDAPAGVALDANGCPIKGDVVLEGVTFETNSAVLSGDSKPVLDTVAKGLKEHPRLVVELQGHTDSTGSPNYNVALSERRAESVRDYLLNQGVSSSQLSAKGYGQTQPIAPNTTAAGRAQNRRVVMHVLDNPGDVVVHKEGQAQP